MTAAVTKTDPHHDITAAARKAADPVLVDIANYVCDYEITSKEAYETARYCLMDTLGCGFLALNYPACAKHLGPIVSGTIVPKGARVPGTDYVLDPVKAAFDIGCMVRWLDFNDTWLAAEWGHPSDNLGAILALADYLNQQGKPLTMRDVLSYMIKAHEIQGVMALENSFNRVGLDHVILVKLASTAVATHMLGGTKEQIINALSHVFVDGQALRTYRHAPNTGPRKSWAAGDATSRAVRLALLAVQGELGYPTALSAPIWGFYDVSFKGKPFTFQRDYGAYVMENILFKISFPAEFHAQTAVEAAITLHGQMKDKLDKIARVEITTHESAMRIINKTGALHNPADRDHCLQYMAAIGLLFGELTADHYEDKVAVDPRIDALRAKMVIAENPQFTKDYLDPEKRSIANTVQVFFEDGSKSEAVTVEYPIGHRLRRAEGIPVLQAKFKRNVEGCFPAAQAAKILNLCEDDAALSTTQAADFAALLVK